MNKVLHFVYIIVIIALLVTLFFSSKRQIKVVENRVTDTIYETIVDTVTNYMPKYITKKVIDTIYIPINDKHGMHLPIEQRYYHNESMYDIWVSGYKTTIDSIKVYPKVEYKTITNNVTKKIYEETLDIYPYTGFKRFNGSIGQVIGLSVKLPNKWVVSGEIGTICGGRIYGVNIGYKIN